MVKSSLAQNKTKLKSVNELECLEAQQETTRHLQITIDKPCVAVYFACRAWPQVGERGIRFYALISELKRVGMNEEAAREKIFAYYHKIPEEILTSPSSDGIAFSEKELESIFKSTFKNENVKSYGCNSHIWDLTCPGPDICHFKKQLSNRKIQSNEAGFFVFLSWLGAKDEQGNKLLKDSDVRIYLSLIDIERKRGYKPGSLLFVTWQEISTFSGISRQNIGDSLQNLFWQGLICYQKGQAQKRGQASEIKRVIPVPHSKKVRQGKVVIYDGGVSSKMPHIIRQ